jgi:hypothetical protein
MRAREHAEICVPYRLSTAKMVTRTHLNVTLYVHCMSCVLYVCLSPCPNGKTLFVLVAEIKNVVTLVAIFFAIVVTSATNITSDFPISTSIFRITCIMNINITSTLALS